MAKQKTPKSRKKLKQDSLVDQLRPNPSGPPPGVTKLDGFLGKSDKPGHWRLYDSATLDSYYEIAEADIIESFSTATEKQPLGGTSILVRGEARIDHTRNISPGSQAADFLQGDITARYLSGANPSLGSSGLGALGTFTYLLCPFTGAICQVLSLPNCETGLRCVTLTVCLTYALPLCPPESDKPDQAK